MSNTPSPAVERPIDVVARSHYEWGIGRGNDLSFDEAPKSIRDRCYHAADATMRALTSLPTRDAAIEEAAKRIDRIIDTYRASGVDECLDDINSLEFARDKIRALKSPTSGEASAPPPLSEPRIHAGAGHAPSSAAESGAGATREAIGLAYSSAWDSAVNRGEGRAEAHAAGLDAIAAFAMREAG